MDDVIMYPVDANTTMQLRTNTELHFSLSNYQFLTQYRTM